MKKPLKYLYLVQSLFLLPSILYWLSKQDWSLASLNAFSIFPLLGLLAFTIMWFHLMVAALIKLKPKMFDYSDFYRKTSNAVLALIIAHPLLLIYKSIQNSTSAFDYAGDNGKVFIVFGSVALLLFLAYEVVDRLRDKPILKNNWQFVIAANRIGFVLVYVHGLQVGQHLQSGWLKALWIFYGITTAIYFVWSYSTEIREDRRTS